MERLPGTNDRHDSILQRRKHTNLVSGAALAGTVMDQTVSPADMRVLVVGAGIAGLGAARALGCAGASVVVAEARPSAGGNAFSVAHDGVEVDPGFGTFRAATYPNFMRLLEELAVETRVVGHTDDYVTRFHASDEIAWNDLSAIPYAQHVLAELYRFANTHAPRILASDELDGVSAGEFFQRFEYSWEFVHYVFLGTLVYGYGGHPLSYYLDYPIRELLEAGYHPGDREHLLRLAGGASAYVAALVRELEATRRVELLRGVEVRILSRQGQIVAAIDGREQTFDALVLTPMPSQALAVLCDTATDEERAVLGAFEHTDDTVVVHRDASVMPRRESWQHAHLCVPRPEEIEARGPYQAVVTKLWHSNHDGETEAFITHDYRSHGAVRPAGGRELTMAHVRFNRLTVALRKQLERLQGKRATHFAGGYTRGLMLHEDALVSGYAAANAILGTDAVAIRKPRLTVPRHPPSTQAPLPLAAFAALRERRPHHVMFTWVDDAGRDQQELTVADLTARSGRVARALTERGARPGQRALLVYPPGLEFVVALLGCLRAGLVPVPVYPPPPRGHRLDDFIKIVDDCEPQFALTSAEFHAVGVLVGVRMAARGLLRRKWKAGLLRWIVSDALPALPNDGAFHDVELRADDVVLLQYTSGSTGAPRGVMLTHNNLRHQLEAVCTRGVGIDDQSILTWWVPQYHDFGLISGIFSVLGKGAQAYLFSPLAFVKRPGLWMELASRVRATHTAAPDFAYALAAARTEPDQRAELDLSALRVVMCAGEPIRARTVDAFLSAYRVSGLRPQSFCPAYGLAEHTVGVTVNGARSLYVDDELLTRERRVRRGNRCVVGCGFPAPEVVVRIVDPETRQPCPPDAVGEIWVDSPSKAAGYWNAPEATRQTFAARIAGDESGRTWLRTGDEGFFHRGELFVSGRRKDIIIVRGRNLYPQDIEAVVESVSARVRAGRVIAFGELVEGAEQMVIALELRDSQPSGELCQSIAKEVLSVFGVGPHRLLVLGRGAVPKTTSGKLQRGLCRERAGSGALDVEHAWTAPSAGVPVVAAPRATRPSELERLTRILYEQTRMRMAPTALLEELTQLDSLAFVELTVEIQRQFGVSPVDVVSLGATTIAELAEKLAGESRAAQAAVGGELLHGHRDAPLRLFVLGPLFHAREAALAISRSIDPRIAVYGLFDEEEGGALECARRHAERMKSIQPRGPYHVAGYSYGGAVAHLVARLVAAESGDRVDVFLLDAHHPDRPVVAPSQADATSFLVRLYLEAMRPDLAASLDDAGAFGAALDLHQRLSSGNRDAEEFTRMLGRRARELESLTSPEVASLMHQRLDGEMAFFQASAGARARDLGPWLDTYSKVRRVDVPRDHFRLLEDVAAIGRDISATLLEVSKATAVVEP